MIEFGFSTSSSGVLELVMNSEQVASTTGWKLLPHARPLTVCLQCSKRVL